MRGFLACFLVLASHGLLDMLTDGGMGIAVFWPWSDERHFFAWHPLPVAPIGFRILSPWGVRFMLTELLYFFPFLMISVACWSQWKRKQRWR